MADSLGVWFTCPRSPRNPAEGSHDDSKMSPAAVHGSVLTVAAGGEGWGERAVQPIRPYWHLSIQDGRDRGRTPSPGCSVLEQPPTLITGQSPENTIPTADGRANNRSGLQDSQTLLPRVTAYKLQASDVHPCLPSLLKSSSLVAAAEVCLSHYLMAFGAPGQTNTDGWV